MDFLNLNVMQDFWTSEASSDLNKFLKNIVGIQNLGPAMLINILSPSLSFSFHFPAACVVWYFRTGGTYSFMICGLQALQLPHNIYCSVGITPRHPSGSNSFKIKHKQYRSMTYCGLKNSGKNRHVLQSKYPLVLIMPAKRGTTHLLMHISFFI